MAVVKAMALGLAMIFIKMISLKAVVAAHKAESAETVHERECESGVVFPVFLAQQS